MRRSAVVLAVLAAVSLGAGSVAAQGRAGKAPAGPSEADRTRGKAEAPAVVTAAGLSCTIADAAFRGTVTQGKGKEAVKVPTYEVACQEGMGFIVQSYPTKTDAYDCLAVKASATYDEKGALKTGINCLLPGNANHAALLQPTVAKSGIACTVKDAVWLGFVAATGLNRYEVSCTEGGGYFVDRLANGTGTAMDCLVGASANLACKLTPAAEQTAVLRPFLTKAGKSCTISGGRFVGQSASNQNRFYEAACGGTQGFMIEARKDGSVRAIDCVEAKGIGGGCTLTDISGALTQRAQTVVAALAPLGVTCADPELRVIGRETSGAGRQVSELKCSNRPQGLIALVPPEGGAGKADYDDCISAGSFGQQCQLTPKAQILPVLTAAMTAHNRNCDVTDFKNLGPGETADSNWIELACSGGQSWVIDLPKTRARPTRALSCQGWRERGGGQCELPANAGK